MPAKKEGARYAALGLPRGASADDVKQAFRQLARKYHPDVNPGDATAEERFKEVSWAHEVLGDESSKALYDEFDEAGLKKGFDPERARAERAAAARPTPQPRRRPGPAPSDRAGADKGSFGRMVRGMFSGSPEPEKGPDAEVEVQISLAEAVDGTRRTIAARRAEPCEGCGGRGMIADARCGACRGAGRVEKTAKLRVTIPAGVEDGARVRLAGRGGVGRNGGPPGDLFAIIRLEETAGMARDGHDLTVDLLLTVHEAVAGGTARVTTPQGEVALRVPPGAQSGRRLRLAGKGFLDRSTGKRGDLFARILVQVPTGPEAEDLAARMDPLYSPHPRGGSSR